MSRSKTVGVTSFKIDFPALVLANASGRCKPCGLFA
jgi:hypothetical protein